MSFNVSEEEINTQLVGEILCSHESLSDIIDSDLHEKLKSKFASIHLNVIIRDIRAYEFCVLPNESLLITTSNCLLVYDNYYNLVKKIMSINNQAISTYFLTTNSIDKIYFSNSISNQIIMTDLNLNYIKSIASIAENKCHFSNPQGVCIYNQNLFVADTGNNRVVKLNLNLEYLQCYDLNFQPRNLKIIENIVCIRENRSNYNSIHFYFAENFAFKCRYDGYFSSINSIKSMFYVYNYHKGAFCCFNKSGELIEELNIMGFDTISNDYYDGSLAYINGDLLFSCVKAANVLKIP